MARYRKKRRYGRGFKRRFNRVRRSFRRSRRRGRSSRVYTVSRGGIRL